MGAGPRQGLLHGGPGRQPEVEQSGKLWTTTRRLPPPWDPHTGGVHTTRWGARSSQKYLQAHHAGGGGGQGDSRMALGPRHTLCTLTARAGGTPPLQMGKLRAWASRTTRAQKGQGGGRARGGHQGSETPTRSPCLTPRSPGQQAAGAPSPRVCRGPAVFPLWNLAAAFPHFLNVLQGVCARLGLKINARARLQRGKPHEHRAPCPPDHGPFWLPPTHTRPRPSKAGGPPAPPLTAARSMNRSTGGVPAGHLPLGGPRPAPLECTVHRKGQSGGCREAPAQPQLGWWPWRGEFVDRAGVGAGLHFPI